MNNGGKLPTAGKVCSPSATALFCAMQMFALLLTSVQSRVFVTVGRPSVCLPSIDSSNGVRRVCCLAPFGQEMKIDSCGRRAAGAGARQQVWVASR